jgi:glyoxylase-like metal-dependent hydrolase (beta-lactamase superfamily II)
VHHRFTVGNVEIIALSDAVQAYPGSAIYPQAGDALDAYRHYQQDDGGIALNFGCFLLRDPERTILVDTGLGPTENGKLMDELSGAGASTDDVDAVIFTHLHPDHTGWNIDPDTGKPRFSRARYLVPGADWGHYSQQQPQPDSFQRDVQPLMAAGVMDLFDGEHSLSSSSVAVPTPGHTPGHTSIMITSNGERGCILGDVVLTPVDAEELAWANSFDWDHEMARATRLRLVDRLINEEIVVGASHLPAPGIGRFVRLEGRTRWQGFNPSEDAS